MEKSFLQTVEYLIRHRLKLGVAESMTAGLVCASVTEVPGASAFFNGGIVSYTAAVKKRLLKIPATVLKKHTAYSEAAVKLMAVKARKLTKSHFGLAVSGLAGPGRDRAPADFETGDVFFAVALSSHRVFFEKFHFSGDRSMIRSSAAAMALVYLERIISENRDFIRRCYRLKQDKNEVSGTD